jgi:hypothetical protein
MDLERLACLVFFLEGLGAEGPVGYQNAKLDLESLMRLVRGRNDVPSEAITDLDACVKELNESYPSAEGIRERACCACLPLRTMWERWYLMRLAAVQKLSKLIAELGDSKSGLLRTDLSIADKVERLLKLLQWADDLGNPKEKFMEAEEIRQVLAELERNLGDPAFLAVANVPACRFTGTIADEAGRVADRLGKGLRMNPPAKQHLQEALDQLLCHLRPYKGTRKCRPFELFLFAAQNRLKQDKLVRRLPGFIPNPPHPISLSILQSHKGAAIAMGIEAPG